MSAANSTEQGPRIAIMGGGPGGLCMAIRLKQAGFQNLVILEQSQGVGGTWNRNRYPGCACDLPSYLYSFSFEMKRDWSRPYAPQPEILAYMEMIAEKYGLLPHVRFGAGVRAARWNEDVSNWTLELESGEKLDADIVVSAIGMFNDLTLPEIKGLETFAGKRFHSAQWDWDHSLVGKRVGVIGSAASAVQFVPEIVKEAEQVHLFQRTANWVMPKLDTPFTEEELEKYRTDPDLAPQVREACFKMVDAGMTFSDPQALADMENAGREAIQVVKDPGLRAKLTPDHPFGCKRPLLSNNYYESFNRSDLELVTEGIDRITPNAVLTVDGKAREVDTLIIATGFSATKYLSAIDVTGRGGERIEDAWNDGARAYLGITTTGFPNLFMLYGPNTNNGSILSMIEFQVEHVLLHVQRIASEGLAWVDVKPEPMERYNEEVQRAIEGISVWQADCNGYYRSSSGRVVTQWPFSMSNFQERTAKLNPDDYSVGYR